MVHIIWTVRKKWANPAKYETILSVFNFSNLETLSSVDHNCIIFALIIGTSSIQCSCTRRDRSPSWCGRFDLFLIVIRFFWTWNKLCGKKRMLQFIAGRILKLTLFVEFISWWYFMNLFIFIKSDWRSTTFSRCLLLRFFTDFRFLLSWVFK